MFYVCIRDGDISRKLGTGQMVKAYDSIPAVREGLKDYFEFYNYKRRHQSLDRKIPDKVYWNILPQKQVAA